MTDANIAADEVVRLLVELIRIDTRNGGMQGEAKERPAAEWAAELLTDVGLAPRILESRPGRANLIVDIPGENHDLPRSVSRFADDGDYRVESAKMLAILLHGMQGTPYVYQGEELGMTNYNFRIEDCRDIEILNMVRERRKKGWSEERILDAIHRKGRDNARTPMQWDRSRNAGFTTGEPWLLVNPNYKEINAADQMNREDSVFSCYQKLIRLRKERDVFADGVFEPLLEEDEKIFAYRRTSGDGTLLVVCNFSGDAVENPLWQEEQRGELLVSSYTEPGETLALLRPYEGRMYFYQNGQ